MFNFLKNIGTTELIIIAIIVVLLFGAKFLTSFARSSGETIKEMKRVKKELVNSFDGDKS